MVVTVTKEMRARNACLIDSQDSTEQRNKSRPLMKKMSLSNIRQCYMLVLSQYNNKIRISLFIPLYDGANT
jgi:hypothetical protein